VTSASLGAVGLAGCFGSSESWIPLIIRNEDEAHREHTVRVEAVGDFPTKTADKTLQAASDTAVEQFVPTLDYEHTVTITVTVDGTLVTTADRRVFPDITAFTVRIASPEAVNVNPQSAAVTEPTSESVDGEN